MPKTWLSLQKITNMAENIINEIPGYENDSVHYVSATDSEGAVFLAAQMVSDLLNKWNTNVGFFSYTGRCQTLVNLIENKSKVARLYTVNQKTQQLQVLIGKVQGMNNRKSVRKFVIEGIPALDAINRLCLEQFARTKHISITVIEMC